MHIGDDSPYLTEVEASWTDRNFHASKRDITALEADTRVETEVYMDLFHNEYNEQLDPRRQPRGVRRRDWASKSMLISIPRVRELLVTLLVRAGFVR